MPRGSGSPHREKVALIEALVAGQPGVELKGDAMPYTSLNGHMFSVLSKDGQFALRLSKPERVSFVAKYKTPPVIMYGAVMEEYVGVPDKLLAKTDELRKYFASSYAYVASLRPKATKSRAATSTASKKGRKKPGS